jgi:hypothetical protein
MGLGTVLKNMKKKQYVDFQDDFIKDTTLITLIHSFDEAIVSQVVLYHEIGDKVPHSLPTHSLWPVTPESILTRPTGEGLH